VNFDKWVKGGGQAFLCGLKELLSTHSIKSNILIRILELLGKIKLNALSK